MTLYSDERNQPERGPSAEAFRHRGLFEGPSGPRKAPRYALFELIIGGVDVQISKGHRHRECVVCEAYERGLVHMGQGDRWLQSGYEIREV